MSCHSNKPEASCGSLIPDTCVPFTGTILGCFQYEGPSICRQSDFNDFVQDEFCGIFETITTIEDKLDLNITNCSGVAEVKTSVAAAIDEVWVTVCANQGLNTPLNGEIDLKCIGGDCCGTPPATVGELLQALVDKVCCIVSKGVDANGIVLDASGCPDCP